MDEGGCDLRGLKSDGGRVLRKIETHDNTATKVLRRVEDASGNVGTQPFCPPGEHGEEGTEEGGGEDDEDGGNAEAREPGVAAARAAVDVVVVASEDVCTVHVGDVREGGEAGRGWRARMGKRASDMTLYGRQRRRRAVWSRGRAEGGGVADGARNVRGRRYL